MRGLSEGGAVFPGGAECWGVALLVCGLCAVAGDDFVVFAFASAAEGIVLA